MHTFCKLQGINYECSFPNISRSGEPISWNHPSFYKRDKKNLFDFSLSCDKCKKRHKELGNYWIQSLFYCEVSINIASEKECCVRRNNTENCQRDTNDNNEWMKKRHQNDFPFNNRISTPSAHIQCFFMWIYTTFCSFSLPRLRKRGLNLVKNNFLSECSIRLKFICKTPRIFHGFLMRTRA